MGKLTCFLFFFQDYFWLSCRPGRELNEERQESLGGEEDVQERSHAIGLKPEQVKAM